MSIDQLKISTFAPLTQPLTGQKPATPQPVFEQLLEAMVRDSGQPKLAVDQASAALRLAQLQLLQGLFQVDGQDESDDLFASLHLNPQVTPPVGGSQQADRFYREMQPSLRELKSCTRSDIERMIDQVAGKVSLAPELIHSVVAAESDFRSQAVSPAGAQGLMQLMPATAKDLGVQDSFDPQQNLLGGSRYLKQLLDKYEGDLDKTLAAYNWGQGNVDRKGLEQMPQETRAYLAKVKGLLTAKG